jgi:Aspartyl protease
MCKVWLRIIVISTAIFFRLPPEGTAQPIKTVTLSFRSNSGPFVIIPVMVNGTGPYDFVLDTGSTSTLIDASLFKTLGLRQEGTTELTSSVADHQMQATATVSEVTLNGISATALKVVSVDNFDSRVGAGLRNSGVSGAERTAVRGILRENFLDQFDLLIDNVGRLVTLNATEGLTQMFDGERLPLSPTSSFEGNVVNHRPMVSATVMNYSNRPLRLLLDTASNFLAIVPGKGALGGGTQGGNAAPVEIMTLGGKVACAAWKDQLRWGLTSVNKVDIVSCSTARAEALDNQGSMPTFIFKRILISHAKKYVVLNPVRRSAETQDHSIRLR